MYEDDEIITEVDEAEIERRLSTLNIPVSDEYFADSKPAPYAVYHTPEADYYGADGYSLKRDQQFRVELYIRSKRDKLRKQFLKLFSDVEFHVEEESGGQRNYYYVGITFVQTLDAFDDVYDDESEVIDNER